MEEKLARLSCCNNNFISEFLRVRSDYLGGVPSDWHVYADIRGSDHLRWSDTTSFQSAFPADRHCCDYWSVRVLEKYLAI